MKKLTMFILVSVPALLIAGCGGGGSSSSTATTTPPPAATVTGIATPATISVVTAQ